MQQVIGCHGLRHPFRQPALNLICILLSGSLGEHSHNNGSKIRILRLEFMVIYLSLHLLRWLNMFDQHSNFGRDLHLHVSEVH